MQAKIVIFIATALLAGTGSAEAEPWRQYRNRCCCYAGTSKQNTKIPCVYSDWTGPQCPAGQNECVK